MEYTVLRINKIMNITLKKISLMLLLGIGSISTSSVFAQSQYRDDGYRHAADSERDRSQGREQQRGRSRDRDDNDARGDSQHNDARKGRMSADERRALRQQIDEAGREIYKPRR